MNWDQLRFFLAVAETGSLQGASRKLAVNHSTVFRRINSFEDSMNARLFDRLPDGYRLTTAGQDLFDHAKRIGHEIDELSLKVLGKDYKPKGTVRLTAPDNLAYEYLPNYLTTFASLYPEIDIELVVGAESLDLTRREADVAVRATPSPPGHLAGRRIVSLKWGCFASNEYLAESGRPKVWGDLGKHRLIGGDGPIGRLPPFRALENDHGAEFAMRCSTLNAMSAMAQAGFGIALLPDDQIKPELNRLFEVEPSFETQIWILTHPELRRTERVRLLIDHLFESFRSDNRLRPA